MKMETKTIYVIINHELDAIDSETAVFDNREDVEKFFSRFKGDSTPFSVRELVINPSFRSDKERDPYTVSLHRSGAVNCYVDYKLSSSEMAFDKRYRTFGNELDAAEYLEYHLLAENVEEALAEGMERIEQLLQEGVFQIDGELRKDNF